MDRSTEEKTCRRKDPTRTGLIAGLLWFASMFVAMGIALWLTGGKEINEMNGSELWIVAGLFGWIVAALAMMALTLRWMTRAQEKQTMTARELILRGSDGTFEETLLNIAFQPGEPDRRFMMYQDGGESFSMSEEKFSGEKWLPTGRIWQADDEGLLWVILMEENISETVWNPDDDGK